MKCMPGFWHRKFPACLFPLHPLHASNSFRKVGGYFLLCCSHPGFWGIVSWLWAAGVQPRALRSECGRPLLSALPKAGKVVLCLPATVNSADLLDEAAGEGGTAAE